MRRRGLNTAGFISGYRGSPLGVYDQALWQAKKHLAAQNIVFQPGVNERARRHCGVGHAAVGAAAAKLQFDGVFGIWYGKGRAPTAVPMCSKHANRPARRRMAA